MSKRGKDAGYQALAPFFEIILEYAVHGKIVRTGVPYDNRFISVITIENRKMCTGGTTWTRSPHGRR